MKSNMQLVDDINFWQKMKRNNDDEIEEVKAHLDDLIDQSAFIKKRLDEALQKIADRNLLDDEKDRLVSPLSTLDKILHN